MPKILQIYSKKLLCTQKYERLLRPSIEIKFDQFDMFACWVRDSFTFEILLRSWHLINGCPLEKAICNRRQEMTLLLQPLHETPIHQSYTIRLSTFVPIYTTASRRKVLEVSTLNLFIDQNLFTWEILSYKVHETDLNRKFAILQEKSAGNWSFSLLA